MPVGRNGSPEDVAAAFVFLASEEAGFITGHTLVVDYGRSINGGSARFNSAEATMVGIPGANR